MSHKAGFVSIIGKPNVGKSTLMNRLVGERLSAITPKAQTTRHRILGIYNDDDTQIVFSDTPGIIDPAYRLHEGMMGAVSSSLADAELVLYLVELGEKPDAEVVERIGKLPGPLMVVLNKADKMDPFNASLEHGKWAASFPTAQVFIISALSGDGTDHLLSSIKLKLPDHPPYYDKEEITDRPVRFFISEMIREQMLLQYQKEIPYSVEVVVEEYKEDVRLDRLRAIIFCERETQKQIIIGKGGAAIKQLGIEARKTIETFVGKQVHMELHVKVRKDWRNDPLELKRFGYTEK